MNYNPYAAPAGAPPQQPQVPSYGSGQPQPWDIGEVIGHAWQILKAQWPVVVLAPLLVQIIVGVPGQFVGFFMPTSLSSLSSIDDILGLYARVVGPMTIFAYIVQSFFDVGLIRIQVAAARGESPQFSTLFSGASKFLPMLAVKLIVAMLLTAGTLFLIVPGVLAFLVLWPVEYFLVDADQDIGTSFRSAWDATKGQWLNLFLFFLMGVLLLLAGTAACCVGVFVTYPLFRVAKAIVFLRISGRGAPALPPPTAMPPGYGYGYGGPPPGYAGGPPPGAPPAGYGPPGGGGWPPR